jgi:hypothetical protein
MDRVWMPVTAGVLSIISGIISLMGSFLVGISLTVILYSPDWYGYNSRESYFPLVVIWIVVALYILISGLAIAGGVYALKRKVWGLAMAGAIGCVLTLWSWWLGIAAIVFLALSKKEFDKVNPTFSTPLPREP